MHHALCLVLLFGVTDKAELYQHPFLKFLFPSSQATKSLIRVIRETRVKENFSNYGVAARSARMSRNPQPVSKNKSSCPKGNRKNVCVRLRVSAAK